jgi:regulator of protease activity HflC (stomatin/prohibitin superfamily)
MAELKISANHERERRTLGGWPTLAIVILVIIAGLVLVIAAAVLHEGGRIGTGSAAAMAGPGLILLALGVVLSFGFFTLEPNETRVCVLFGAYKGTAREGGFRWGNPFYSNGPAIQPTGVRGARDASAALAAAAKKGQAQRLPRKYPRYKISVRARTLNGPKLKVNDRRGNPVEIATVVVWRVKDTAQAVFDVDDFEQYVETQSETALRHLAGSYAYDHGEESEITLRSNVDEVSQAL